MVGDRRDLRLVVGQSNPPHDQSWTLGVSPPRSRAVSSRKGHRVSGDKPREGAGGRGKKRRLARWSLPERISYFQLPDRPFPTPADRQFPSSFLTLFLLISHPFHPIYPSFAPSISLFHFFDFLSSSPSFLLPPPFLSFFILSFFLFSWSLTRQKSSP